MKHPVKRVCLWSGPRNISTALMYSFAQRPDTRVIDEPLYAHYLSKTDAQNYHPAVQDVLNSQDHDGQNVIRNIIFGDYKKDIIFFKMMTHHLIHLDLSFLADTINIILIRDPKEVITSFVKQIENPLFHDLGYKQNADLYDYLISMGQQPPILDARTTLLNPKKVLTELCARLGIVFYDAMLSWIAGPRKEDGIWASHWYHNVHKSTGFQPYKPKTEPFPGNLLHLLEQCEPYYNRLEKMAVR